MISLSDGRMACKFHAPLRDTSGNETAKAKWDEYQNSNFNEVVDYQIQNADREGIKSDLSGVVFPVEITFSDCECGPDFEQATFHKAAGFQTVSFSKGSSFKETNFLDMADFQGSTFISAISFALAKFSGPSDFSNAEFVGDADFTGSKFKNKSDFTGTQFMGIVNFTHAQFSESISFENTAFEKEVLFDRTQFIDTVNFTEAQFPESISFKNTAFEKEASFQGARFHKATAFTSSRIDGQAHFEDAVFHENCDFSGRSFGRKAFFTRTKFIGDADFFGSQFNSEVDFANTIFTKNANFFNTVFKGSLKFIEVQFEGHVTFNVDDNVPALFFPKLDFSNSTFKDSVLFTNRTFSTSTNFDGCMFFVAPEFQGCTLHQDTKFPPGRNFKDHTHKAAPAYRTLKLDMENFRARQEEAMFNALEQKCQATDPETARMVKYFSSLYELTSNYGQSLGRPIVCMVVVSVLFFLIYLSMAAEFLIVPIIGFTIEQSVSPLKVWRLTDVPVWLSSGVDLVVLKIIATLHSLLFLVFFGLFILVLRWRFKRG